MRFGSWAGEVSATTDERTLLRVVLRSLRFIELLPQQTGVDGCEVLQHNLKIRTRFVAPLTHGLRVAEDGKQNIHIHLSWVTKTKALRLNDRRFVAERMAFRLWGNYGFTMMLLA